MKKSYLFPLVGALFMWNAATAQIVYTDIPDGVPTGIDFNGDGTAEFEISNGNATGDYITYMNGGADNNIWANGDLNTGGWDVPNCVASGTVIDAAGNWAGQGDCAVYGWGTPNPTIAIGKDEYLAVRFNLSGTDVYYGWIRIVVDNAGNVTYKDFAYNSTAAGSIDAGDSTNSTTGITAEKLAQLAVYPNPVTAQFTVSNKENVSCTSIQLTTLLGREIWSKPLTNTLTVSIENLPRGVYLVHFFNGSTRIKTTQLVIQ